MRRLVITGVPCSAEAWEAFLGSRPKGVKAQRILPFREVLENCDSSDPRELSRYVTQQIELFRPDSIVAHDMGVPLTVLSLLRLNKKGKFLDTRVTFFNGSFRKVNLLKANHPLRVQIMTEKKAIREVESRGGKVDLGLAKHFGRIRAMYRLIMIYRLGESLGSWLGLDELVGFADSSRLKSPIQVIGSRNDPYIPFDAVQRLAGDVSAVRFLEHAYGHFPYSGDPKVLLPLVESFEREVRAREYVASPHKHADNPSISL
jgi:hypothetical protein